ncbi:unannotated protein [freshwater metagenome]|uniref:Unannotated protein n=1 Tax=freshwater metagenome TaxID=449393 RepID=A0A6J6IDH5_9ZZZZ|nr:hypothetical protein [Actinomycetota bacterium]
MRRQLRRSNLSALVVLAALALGATACGASNSGSATRLTVTTTTPAKPAVETTTTLEPESGVGRQYFVYAPVVGDCVDLRSIVDGKAATTRALPGVDGTPKGDRQVILRLDCNLPHQYEVVASVNAGLPSSPGPSIGELVLAAKRLCPAAFGAYIGIPYQNSTLEMGWILPRADQLTLGNQQIGCTVLDPKAKLVGTVREAKR